MNWLRKITPSEIVSIALTVLFGVISLVGSITIVVTPTGLNYTILGVLISLVLTGIGINYIRRHNKLLKHRYRTLSSDITVHCEMGRRTPAGRLEPLCRVERKNTIKPLHAFQQDLDFTMMIDDAPGDDVVALAETLNYTCDIVSNKRGPIANTIRYDVPAKRHVGVKVDFEAPLFRGEKLEWHESFLAPNTFTDPTEFYFTTVRLPTSQLVLRIIFHDLQVVGARSETQIDRQQPDAEALTVKDLGNNVCQIEHSWHRPKVGQRLKLSWQWTPASLAKIRNG